MQTTTRKLLTWSAAALLGIGLIGCGGSSRGGSDAATPTGSRTVTGPITGFGSVIVNGIEFETSGAAIQVEDRSGAESNLATGMVVRVEGSVDAAGSTGTASRIHYEDDLQGPVDAVDPVAGNLTVMGVVVQFDDQTVWRHTGPATVAQGDVVEVSGFVANQNGSTIRARYIEGKLGVEDHEMRGTVANLDADAQTFQLAGITVDYSVAVLDDAILEAGGLAEGMLVEAKAENPPVAGLLTADEIELEDEYSDHSGAEVKVEGVITRFAGPEDFDVNGRPCAVSERTRYENGTVSDLALQARVEVEGTVDPNGVLQCSKIEFERAKDIKIEGPVGAVDAAGFTLTVLGSEVIEVFVTADTMLKVKDRPGTEHPSREAFFAERTVGDWVTVHALLADADSDGSADVVAHKVDVEDPDTRVRLQGPITEGSYDAATSVADILGITIDMSAATEFEDSDGSTALPDLNAFLTRLEELLLAGGPVLLKAKGTFTPDNGAGTITASELELENSHDLEHERDEDGSSHEFEWEDKEEHRNPGDDS